MPDLNTVRRRRFASEKNIQTWGFRQEVIQRLDISAITTMVAAFVLGGITAIVVNVAAIDGCL